MDYAYILRYFYRGISSTVRRCVEKETGREFAAKIIDLSNEDNNTQTVRESTLSEVNILRLVAGHPYISMQNMSFES